jgi:hypothetical protein
MGTLREISSRQFEQSLNILEDFVVCLEAKTGR